MSPQRDSCCDARLYYYPLLLLIFVCQCFSFFVQQLHVIYCKVASTMTLGVKRKKILVFWNLVHGAPRQLEYGYTAILE